MNYWIIPSIILGVGFIFCLILIFRGYWLQSRKNIDDYQKGRDKLTFREKKVKVKSSGGGFSLGNIIGAFIVILIGSSLLPVVADQVGGVCKDSNINVTAVSYALCNVEGASSTLLNFVTIFFALAIVGVAISMVFLGLRGAGMV